MIIKTYFKVKERLPKDKTILMGSTVRCRLDLEGSAIKYTVISVKGNPTAKRVSKASRTRMKDIVTMMDNVGKVKKVYAKYLKLIC